MMIVLNHYVIGQPIDVKIMNAIKSETILSALSLITVLGNKINVKYLQSARIITKMIMLHVIFKDLDVCPQMS